jgi:adenylosuccinate synthase
MPNIVIVGAQWGDEGKGKVVDLLTRKVQVVARYNGGHNAGHTVIVGDKKFIVHVIPSGILHSGILCVIGNGMVVNPTAFEKEKAELESLGVEVGDELVISERVHLILPHHYALEALSEEERGSRAIGTTLRGTGPAYEDKAGRRGVTMGDLLRPETLEDKLTDARRHYETLCRGAGRDPEVDWGQVVAELRAFGERHGSKIKDASLVLSQQIARGYSILFEGAQATLLDLDHGTYPFVTSSSATVGGVAVGTGVPPSRIDGVVGVAKAYCTRVGTGPFPSEADEAGVEILRGRGNEYGATTGRPRRCGWFDAVAARYAHRVNGFDSLALTKLDVLDELDEIPICTAYRYEGETLEEFPADLSVLAGCQPVYEKMSGWKASTTGARRWGELPEAARRYIERISELARTQVGLVSTGPDREQTIIRDTSALASWFS